MVTATFPNKEVTTSNDASVKIIKTSLCMKRSLVTF